MNSVLITGAAGFIGSRILKLSQEFFEEIYVVDCFIEGNYPAFIKKRRWDRLKSQFPQVNFIECDLRESAAVMSLPGVKTIINEAAVPGLPMSWQNFELYSSCNLSTLNNLVDYALATGATKFVQASTSSVYGVNAIGKEEQDLNPVSPYGVTKLAAEKLLIAKTLNSNIQTAILRYFSVYGPGQRSDMAFSKFIDSMLNQRPIEVTGSLKSSRTNTFVDDVADVTLRIAIERDHHSSGVFNVSGEQSVTLEEAITQISSVLGVNPQLVFMPPRKGDQIATKGDITKLKSLGYKVNKTSFEDGIRKQIEHFRLENNL